MGYIMYASKIYTLVMGANIYKTDYCLRVGFGYMRSLIAIMN